MTIAESSPTRCDTGTLATFLLPDVSRPFVARIAKDGPRKSDLPILLQFAPSHPDPDVHRMLLAALTRILPRAEVRKLFARLYELPGPARARRRELIREVLATFHASFLLDLWARSDESERLDTLRLLERKPAHKHVPTILRELRLLQERNPRIRSRVTSLLGRLPSSSRKAFLKRDLRSEQARVRANAIEALVPLLSPREAKEILMPLTRDPAPRVRANALHGLILLGHRSAKDDLADMLGSLDVAAKASARWVMNQLPKSGTQRAVKVA